MLHLTTQRVVEMTVLNSTTTEDEIWGAYQLQAGIGASSLVWRSGILSPLPPVVKQLNSPLRLVLLPDLTKLRLAAIRACTMLIGAPTANLERHGRHEQWSSDLCWLAASKVQDLGQVSPHLLDRFALRLEGRSPAWSQRVTPLIAQLEQAVIEAPAFAETTPIPVSHLLTPAMELQLRAAGQLQPAITDKAVERVLTLLPAAAHFSLRRPLSLARLAVGVTQLQGLPKVTCVQVNTAASILWTLPALPVIMPVPLDTPVSTQHVLTIDQESHTEPSLPEEREAKDGLSSSGSTQGGAIFGPPGEIPIGLPGDREAGAYEDQPVTPGVTPPEGITSAPPVAIPVIPSPYREDTAPIERELEPLRMPAFSSPRHASRGPIIGTAKARNLYDLAFTSTLLESAKFQAIRRKSSQELVTGQPRGMFIRILHHTTRSLLRLDSAKEQPQRMLILPSDLRTYRREPAPEQLLVLVLDYTALRDCEWTEALVPHLNWAYVCRAKICLIQVGSRSAVNPLQATCIMARSLLTPRLGTALAEAAGRATPLAHGLDLARSTLQKALQHGRNTVRNARLVVLTDGRGNIPLEFSRANRVPHSIAREGIDDAFKIARLLASMSGIGRVDKILLDPQPRQYPGLPAELARALQATRLDIPLSSHATEI